MPEYTPYPNNLVLSLMTGRLVGHAVPPAVWGLASFMMDMPVTSDGQLDAVRWICDHRIRKSYPHTAGLNPPSSTDDDATFDDWLAGLNPDFLRGTTSLKPLREYINAKSHRTALSLVSEHPIALWDLLAFLKLLGNDGFRMRILSYQPKNCQVMTYDEERMLDELHSLGQNAITPTLGAWLESVIDKAHALKLVADRADEMLRTYPGSNQIKSQVITLPDPILVTLLTQDCDRKEADEAGILAGELLRHSGTLQEG